MSRCKRISSLQATILMTTLQLSCLLIVPIFGLGLRDGSISCWSKDFDTTCIKGDSCKSDNRDPNPLLEMCYENYPVLDYNDNELQHPCKIAQSDDQSTRYDGAPSVSATFETYNYDLFNMNVTWSHNTTNRSRVEGYEVRVLSRTEDSQFTRLFFFCVPGRDARSLNIVRSQHLSFGYWYQLKVEVRAYPLPAGDVQQITGKNCTLWSGCVQDPTGSCGNCITYPQSCLDFGLRNCHPPRYPPPTNLQVHRLMRPVNVSETLVEQALQLNLQWDPPNVVQEEYQVATDKFTYYVQLSDVDSYERIYFNANGTGNLSVSVFPLNQTSNYTLRLLTYYPCAGSADPQNGRDYIGCGAYGPYFYSYFVPPYSTTTSILPSTTTVPSTATTVPSTATTLPSTATTVISTTATTTYQPPSNETSTGGHPLMEPIVIATIAVVIVAFLIILLMFSIVFGIVLSKRSVKTVEHQPRPRPTPSKKQFEKKQLQVLVMYSPRTDWAQREYILEYVVNGLRRRCRNIDVTYPDDQDFIRGCVVGKIEEKVTQCHAVLIVCNEAFQRDWEDSANSSQHVNALRQLIHSNVGRNQLEKKFALVILDNNSSCIPSEYLKQLNKFNVGEQGTDEGGMIHFVTNTSPYQLASLPELLSPQSDTTMDFYTDRQNHQHSASYSSISSSEATSLPLSEDSLILLQESVSVECTSWSSSAKEVQTDSSFQPQVDSMVSDHTKLNIPISMVSPAVSQSDLIQDSNL